MEAVEIELRREAARRRLAGESPELIARDLGRTRQWVAKWAARYDPARSLLGGGSLPGAEAGGESHRR